MIKTYLYHGGQTPKVRSMRRSKRYTDKVKKFITRARSNEQNIVVSAISQNKCVSWQEVPKAVTQTKSQRRVMH